MHIYNFFCLNQFAEKVLKVYGLFSCYSNVFSFIKDNGRETETESSLWTWGDGSKELSWTGSSSWQAYGLEIISSAQSLSEVALERVSMWISWERRWYKGELSLILSGGFGFLCTLEEIENPSSIPLPLFPTILHYLDH